MFGTTSGRRLPRNVAPRKCLAFSFADIVRDFLRKPENAWLSTPIGTWSGRRLPPKPIVRTIPSESGVRMPTVRAPIAAAVSTAR